MSAPLHLPLDYEQLPEFWQLKTLLQSLRTDTSPRQIEAAASWIFTRLFVALGYQARSSNRPGLLPPAGALQFRASFEPYFGDDCNVIDLLEKSGLLKAPAAPAVSPLPSDGSAERGKTGWICELFAQMNPHLAGDFKPAHLTGNVNSRISAYHKKIAGAAWLQTKLLLPGIFRRPDGTPIEGQECAACVVLVRMIDRCLNVPGAHTKNSAFSDGLMASASAVLAAHSPEQLMPFYYWLGNHYEHPMIPKNCEEILADFEKYFALMQK